MKKITTLLSFAIFMANLAACQNTTEVMDTIISEQETFNKEGPIVAPIPPQPPPPPPDQLTVCSFHNPLIMPRFPGCEDLSLSLNERKKCADEKMLHFIQSNLTLPRDFCGEGMVVVRFTVEVDGSITDLKVVRDIGGGCGEEALRVVKMMPNWVPGEERGKIVRTMMHLPFKFKLDAFPAADTVYTYVDEMPRFPGCEEDDILGSERQRCADEKMLQFLFENLHFPELNQDENWGSACIIKFIVEKDGSISNVSISRSFGNEKMDREALRVVRSMPKWTPGKHKERPVRVAYNLPLKIRLE